MKDQIKQTGKELTDKIRARIHGRHDDLYSAEEVTKNKEDLVERFWIKYKDHHDHHAAWQEFYRSLDPNEKNDLWEQYHGAVKNGANSSMPTSTATQAPSFNPSSQKTVADFKKEIAKQTQSQSHHVSRTLDKKQRLIEKAKFHLGPIITALVAMSLVFLISMNHVVLAKVKQYVSPGDTLASPVIVDPNEDIEVGDEPRIIIPKINVDVPVVYDVKGYDEAAIQAGLERGVVHYGETALPGQFGNNVIVGHSSNNFFNKGKYKFAFVLLSRLEAGDLFILHYKGERYVYKVFNKQVIEPNDFSLIQPTSDAVTTLITCDPPGTSWRRLVVQGKQISPDPDAVNKQPASNAEIAPPQNEVVPGSAPSVWDRIFSIF